VKQNGRTEALATEPEVLAGCSDCLAVLTAITMILSDELGIELDPETIVAIILPVVAYILGEAYVDAQGVKKE
jgi:hypothetical protein